MLLDKAPQLSHSRVLELLISNENDLAPNVVSIFPLGWSNTSFPVDLRLYNEFDFFYA